MSYSNLVSYVKLSPFCVRRTGPVKGITPHHAAGDATVEALGDLFAMPSKKASANYGIGTDGRIACYVEEEYQAYTSSDRENDDRCITIEVANCSGEPDWKISDAAYKSLIDLCVDICKRHGFRLNYTGDTSGNLTMHQWFIPTKCPGPYLKSKFPEIAAEVNRRLAAEQEAEDRPEKPVEEAVPEEADTHDFTLGMRYLRRGCEGGDVRALQHLLIANGCTCGGSGPDGKFGPATESALIAFQNKKGLAPDGVAGPLTMAPLLGLQGRDSGHEQ